MVGDVVFVVAGINLNRTVMVGDALFVVAVTILNRTVMVGDVVFVVAVTILNRTRHGEPDESMLCNTPNPSVCLTNPAQRALRPAQGDVVFVVAGTILNRTVMVSLTNPCSVPSSR
jgi:hypothetical protein